MNISRRTALIGLGAGATAFGLAGTGAAAAQQPTRANFVWFQTNTTGHIADFLACLANNKLLTGVSFNVSPDRIDANDFSEIEYVISKVPANFALQINMTASGLSLNKTYPFATERLMVSYDGRSAVQTAVPVINDPKLVPWMVDKWTRIVAWLTANGHIARLNGGSAALTTPAYYDPEQVVPGNFGASPAQQAAFWAALGVNDDAIVATFATYAAQLTAGPLHGRYLTALVWHPTKTGVGQSSDGGAFYTRLVDGMIAAAARNGGQFVPFDQSIDNGVPRAEIQACADTAKAFAGQLVAYHSNISAFGVLAAYKSAWQRPDTRWVEIHPNEVATLTKLLNL